jgi:bifunctional N-acetylglucosamine-1-phosphate-uridyltransferase/glucosamine-1-phosphate-acetyltransferase GlmU-like protein
MNVSAKPSLVVLAAGLGRRYGGRKQLDGLGPRDELLLEYAVHDARRAGFGPVVLVVHPDLEPELRGKLARHEGITFLHQETPLGTGHATLCARDAIGGPFAVANADDFYGRRSYEVLHAALAEGIDEHVLVGFDLARTLSPEGPVSRAVCEVDVSRGLISLVERHDVVSGESGALVSMNLWGFRPEILPPLAEAFAAHDTEDEFQLPTAVSALVRGGRARVRVVETPDDWFGVTWPGDRERVAARLREAVDSGEYPSPLRSAP